MALTAQRFVRLGLAVCFFGSVGCGARSPAPPLQPIRRAAPPPPAPAPVSTGETPPTPIASRLLQNSANCELVPGNGERITTVALGERVEPGNAPHPINTSERLLFRQLYETLVRVDCEGIVAPGLAASWRASAEQGKWIITLRMDARFSDASPVTAADVVSAWTVEGKTDVLRPGPEHLIRSVLAVDERTLEIVLRSQYIDVPTALAHTDLAVAKRQPGSSWPLGTRAVRINYVEPNRNGALLIALTGDTVAPTRFVVAPGSDGRDFLDDGTDLLLTRDARTIAYAATLPQFTAVPLAWQQTQVMLMPRPAPQPSLLSDEARQSFAREAIRGEARGAQGPFWWQLPLNCSQENAPVRTPAASTSGRVVYDSGDTAARDLAERLVGLDPSRKTYQRSVGLLGDALAASLRRGDDAAYIMTLERPLDPCREMHFLSNEVGWLDPATIVPLVDTRLQAIVRRGHSGVIAEWDGGLLLMGSQK